MVFISACAYDKELVGPVEDVNYVESNDMPCYVALGSDEGQYHYHGAYKLEQCKFAERAMMRRKAVKMYIVYLSGSENNGIKGIEYAK